jgi:hypothetical protein
MSLFGQWDSVDELPVFNYSGNQDEIPEAKWDPKTMPPTRRHWLMIGNQAISARVANDGRCGLLDERYGHRWLTHHDPGTGISIVESDGSTWGTSWDQRPREQDRAQAPVRTFGPTWFTVTLEQGDIGLKRTILCPEGEYPWVLVHIEITNGGQQAKDLTHTEEWAVEPRFISVYGTPDDRLATAREAIAFKVDIDQGRILAREERPADPAKFVRSVKEGDPLGGDLVFNRKYPQIFGPETDFLLETLGDTQAVGRCSDDIHPTLSLKSTLRIEPGESCELWYRVGAPDAVIVEDPVSFSQANLSQLKQRLPTASAASAAMAQHEIPWHAAMLSGGLCSDAVIGGHTLNQSSAYLDPLGFNGAARDPLQHALPLVYLQPQMALSVLRNTCAWARPDGELPYALDGAKRPVALSFRPSDQSLWALLLAAEYCGATGDEAAFDQPLPYHPSRKAEPVPLKEHLRRQFRNFVDIVGVGEHGHVRILNADWNDMAIALSGVSRAAMAQFGESVLNTAMAAYVLPIYAGLCDRLGDTELAQEARDVAEQLRQAVASEWNGRWFHRAYAPGKGALGQDDCWLEVQPWAILCGAATDSQITTLLEEIDTHLRTGSPLGARVRGPIDKIDTQSSGLGTGTDGGIWFAINMTLVWAASRHNQDLAWDEWRRNTLASHTEAYPGIWMGTLSGPDCYNGVESPHPGETWGIAIFAMQSNPVNNQHSHSGPLLSYLRLLGVEVTSENKLRVRGGAAFESARFCIDEQGHGWLQTMGQVTVETPFGEVSGSGRLEW